MSKLPGISLRIKLIIAFVLVATLPLLLVFLLQLFSFIWYALILVIIVSLIIGFIVTFNILKPIHELKRATEQFSHGNFDVRLDIHTSDELEELSKGFSNMATQLNNLITTLKREREVLSGERNKLSVIVSGITDAVIAVDLGRRVILFNTEAQNLTGYTEAEVLGKPIDSVIKLYEDDAELLPTNYCPITNLNFEGVVLSKKLVTIVGKIKSRASLMSGQIKEGEAINLGCLLTFHNLNQEMDFERMKLDFVSMAAHELRTPLTSIRGYLSILQTEVKFDDEHKQFLDRSMIAALQLNDLVENLLSVAKIERGALAISKQPLDWVNNVKSLVSELNQRAIEKKISLSFIEPTQTIPNVHVDKLRVNEVVSNLVSNAINYTSPGGSIKVSIETKDGQVVTHVTDTGQGIPKEALAHLFTKFFRVSGVLGQGSKGTGLGLYISKSIVDMHNGKIWVESEVGKGSTFSFSLPTTPV
jgi:signal transduction histidine kinase